MTAVGATCGACNAPTRTSDLQYDEQGRALCKMCFGGALARQARTAEAAGGGRRMCGTCGHDTMIGRDLFRAEAEGHEMPVTVAHRFSCSRCQHTATLLAPGGVFMLLVFLGTASGALALGDHRDDPNGMVAGIVFAAVAALILLRDLLLRARNRGAR